MTDGISCSDPLGAHAFRGETTMNIKQKLIALLAVLILTCFMVSDITEALEKEWDESFVSRDIVMTSGEYWGRIAREQYEQNKKFADLNKEKPWVWAPFEPGYQLIRWTRPDIEKTLLQKGFFSDGEKYRKNYGPYSIDVYFRHTIRYIVTLNFGPYGTGKYEGLTHLYKESIEMKWPEFRSRVISYASSFSVKNQTPLPELPEVEIRHEVEDAFCLGSWLYVPHHPEIFDVFEQHLEEIRNGSFPDLKECVIYDRLNDNEGQIWRILIGADFIACYTDGEVYHLPGGISTLR